MEMDPAIVLITIMICLSIVMICYLARQPLDKTKSEEQKEQKTINVPEGKQGESLTTDFNGDCNWQISTTIEDDSQTESDENFYVGKYYKTETAIVEVLEVKDNILICNRVEQLTDSSIIPIPQTCAVSIEKLESFIKDGDFVEI